MSYADDPRLTRAMRRLVGCDWGYFIGSPDDHKPCNECAVRRIVLHGGNPNELLVQLCAKHRDLIYEMTDEHEISERGVREDFTEEEMRICVRSLLES